MGDEALIRREALIAALKARGLKEMHAQVSHLSGLGIARDTYWRDLLKGQKSFGEKMARKIEGALSPPLPRGYLDNPAGRYNAGADFVVSDATGQVKAVVETKAPRPLGIAPPPPDSKFTDAREISDSDWATLEAVKLFIPEQELKELRERADRFKAKVLADLSQVV